MIEAQLFDDTDSCQIAFILLLAKLCLFLVIFLLA